MTFPARNDVVQLAVDEYVLVVDTILSASNRRIAEASVCIKLKLLSNDCADEEPPVADAINSRSLAFAVVILPDNRLVTLVTPDVALFVPSVIKVAVNPEYSYMCIRIIVAPVAPDAVTVVDSVPATLAHIATLCATPEKAPSMTFVQPLIDSNPTPTLAYTLAIMVLPGVGVEAYVALTEVVVLAPIAS